MTEIIAPRQEAVLIEVGGENPIIVPQKEAVVVEARTEAAIITPQSEAIIIEAGQQGPRGATGPPGPRGRDGQPLPPGHDGDIIRYNEATGEWESRSEPFEFQGLILIPLDAPLVAQEGYLYYNALDKSIYVSVD